MKKLKVLLFITALIIYGKIGFLVFDPSSKSPSKYPREVNQKKEEKITSNTNWTLSRNYSDPFYTDVKIHKQTNSKPKQKVLKPKVIPALQDPPPLELLGIIGSEKSRIAVLRSPKGVIQLKEDEQYDQWVLSNMEPGSATFQKEGRVYVLKKG